MTHSQEATHSPIPQRVRLVAFDLDGTLADTFEDIAEATNHALMAFGHPTLPTEEIKSLSLIHI